MKKLFAIVLAVVILCSMLLVPVSASSSGEIGTDKAEYLVGEMVEFYYSFSAKDSNRQIWIYKGSVAEENRIWVMSATGLENHGLHIEVWPENTLLTPGNYIMRVADKSTKELDPNITATFTVKDNPDLDREVGISLDKTTYNLDDTIVVSYKGITDALPKKALQITFYDENDIPANETPIYLWDAQEPAKMSGTIEVDMSELDFWAGSYYAVVEMQGFAIDYSSTRIDFTVVDPSSTTEAPATDAPATDVPTTDAPATDAPVTDAPATDAPATEIPNDGTEAPVATEQPDGNGGSNVMLWVVVGIAGALLVALVVVVILLIKKKK